MDAKHTPTLGLVLPLAIIKHAGTNNAVSIRDNGGRGEWVASSDTTKADALVTACNQHAHLVAQNERLRAALELAVSLPFELNMSNYTHEDVCELNMRVVEVILAARTALSQPEKHI